MTAISSSNNLLPSKLGATQSATVRFGRVAFAADPPEDKFEKKNNDEGAQQPRSLWQRFTELISSAWQKVVQFLKDTFTVRLTQIKTKMGISIKISPDQLSLKLLELSPKARESYLTILPSTLLNQVDENGNTVVHKLICNRKKTVIDGALISRKEVSDEKLADILKILLPKLEQQTIDRKNTRGETALFDAAEQTDNLDTLKALLSKMSDEGINAIDLQGYTALDCAIGRPRWGGASGMQEFEVLINAMSSEAIGASQDKFSPIRANFPLAKLILQKIPGKDIVASELEDGTPLIWLALFLKAANPYEESDLNVEAVSIQDLVSIIIPKIDAAQVNAFDSTKATALHYFVTTACKTDNLEPLKALLKHPDIDFSLTNDKQQTALDIAKASKKQDVITLLEQRIRTGQ